VPVEGRAMSEETLKLAQSAFGSDGQGTLQPTRTLAWLYLGMRRNLEAAQQFEVAVRLDRAIVGSQDIFTCIDLSALGACYCATDRVAQSHELLQAAVDRIPTAEVPSSGSIGNALVLGEFGLTLLQEARFPEAEAWLRRALAEYDRTPPRPLAQRLRPKQRALSGLGQALARQGKFAEAEPLVLQAFQELKADELHLAGDRAGMVRQALEAVVELYRAWQKPEQLNEWSAKLEAFPATQS
jgi:tetratricopeptide (TPR) repeat protein